MASPTTQTAVEHYVAAFSDFQIDHPAPAWLSAKRREAMEAFKRLGFPTVRDEEWKYTDVTPVANLAATPVFRPEAHGAAPQTLPEHLPFNEISGHKLVFVNGHFAPALSDIGELPAGATITSMAQAFGDNADIVTRHFGKHLDWRNETFAALNTAFAQDGALIHLERNVQIEETIRLVFLATGDGETVTHPRNLIVLGENASAHVLETYASTEENVYFNNAVTEVETANGAQLEHIKVQLESPKAFHVATLQIHSARDVTASSHCLNFGGRIVRNNANAVLADENGEVTLNGLVLGRDSQHIDNHTSMDHAKPHCDSHENYAHVLDDHSVGVFNGKIFVREDAQKTDAKQSNRTLLLSRDAQIDAKPQLEIFADDVKCTHGATIGQLDEEALFYLRARGVPEKQARKILIRAFAAEVFESISHEDVRAALERELEARLG